MVRAFLNTDDDFGGCGWLCSSIIICFYCAGISRLRTRPKGNENRRTSAIALWKPSVATHVSWIMAKDFIFWRTVSAKQLRLRRRGWSSKKDMPDVESQACLFAICTYFRYCTARITTPSTTKTTPTTRLSVSGFDLFAIFAAICANSSVNAMMNTLVPTAVFSS